MGREGQLLDLLVPLDPDGGALHRQVERSLRDAIRAGRLVAGTALPSTRALAAELGDRVGVTMLTPGGMQTHFFDGRPDQYKPGPDAKLMDPAEPAQAVVFALTRPPGTELREMVMTVATEPSWP